MLTLPKLTLQLLLLLTLQLLLLTLQLLLLTLPKLLRRSNSTPKKNLRALVKVPFFYLLCNNTMVKKLLCLVIIFFATKASLPLVAGVLPPNNHLEPGPAFTLHPNPVTGTWFHINLAFSESDYPNAKFSISNVLGEVIYVAPIKKTEFAGAKVRVDIAELKIDRGVYFVPVSSGDPSRIIR
jgi:hypothetical protein